MIKLKSSEIFGRRIRQGTWEEIGIPTWTLVRAAIQEGRRNEAIELLDYASNEAKTMHDTEHALAEAACTYIAEALGEEELQNFWRMLTRTSGRFSFLSAATLEDAIKQTAECQRGHFGHISVEERPDKYVVTYNPCGSLGRLWESKPVGMTTKPAPWNWNMVGVPYFCTHCNIFFETVPAEKRGYPDRVTFPPEKPGAPCLHYYYKDPSSIPEEYFARIGKIKPIQAI